jgi:hypothetical protein
MRLPVKIAIGCAIGACVIVIFGFIAFPKMIKGKVKKVSRRKAHRFIEALQIHFKLVFT